MNEQIYTVFRVYSPKEREDPNDRYVFYGWSFNKSIIKAFLEQRNPKKYKVIKENTDDRRYVEVLSEACDSDHMIDFMRILSAETKEEVIFFTTLQESRNAEMYIQEKFHALPSIDDMNQLSMFMNLDRYYLDALDLLGFRPPEVDMIFDTSDERDNYNTLHLVKEEINDAYDGMIAHPPDDFERYMNVPGSMLITNVCDKILYSIENFVSVLLEDL